MRRSNRSRVLLGVSCALLLMAAAGHAQVVNLAGDMDDFGFGMTPPCVFFDNSGPGDLGIFDRELTSGDEVEAWTHDFSMDPEFAGCQVESVTVEIREYFSDNMNSTISIDGNVLTFPVNGVSQCNGMPIVQSFNFAGPAAAFAQDGVIDMVFSENGDDIGLDWSQVTIECGMGVPTMPPVGLIALLVLLLAAGSLFVLRRGLVGR